ncbi:hypothetical protein GCM10022280_02040 [Sphingomonas swuensis]|uniref:Bacterial surface antigen (D15) domain-containing protein n=1 Tax=Sphingomonas swuensis TaxID=977800 RepID=A0ABP7SAC9_9SPHN
MSAPIRFLGLAIIAYVGLRTASSALALAPMSPAIPPQPTAEPMLQDQLAASPLPPPGTPSAMDPGTAPAAYAYPYNYAAQGYAPAAMAMAMPPQAYAPVPYPMPYPVMQAVMPRSSRQSRPPVIPAPYAEDMNGFEPAPVATPTAYESAAPALDQWPTIGTAGPFSLPAMQTTPSWGGKDEKALKPLDVARASGRWSLDAWALLRPPQPGIYSNTDPGAGLNPGLASAGSLGGSQAGMRLTFRPWSRLGVHLRASTALMPQGRGGQALAGGEGAVGVSYQPFGSIPVRLMAERRQRLGQPIGGGRNAFVMMAEGGIYDRPLAYGIRLDGYGQAGIAGARSRDLFADGALAATYPFLPRFAIGGGVWGGLQPGLSRLDAGPRLSYQIHPRMRLNLDYRWRLTGNATPVSGPALTISGGF